MAAVKEGALVSAALANAIGYENVSIGGPTGHYGAYVQVPSPGHPGFTMAKRFDFEDPLVIWPIAERYDCFPRRHPHNPEKWLARRMSAIHSGSGATPARAVAAAVIAMHLGGEL